LPSSGKFVPPTTKAYAKVLGAQTRVSTIQKVFPNSSHHKKKVVACRKMFIISKPKTSPSPPKKNAGSTVPNGTKNTRKHPNSVSTFIGGL